MVNTTSEASECLAEGRVKPGGVTWEVTMLAMNTLKKLAAVAAVLTLAASGSVAAARPAAYETRTVGYGGNRTSVVFARKAPAGANVRPYALTGAGRPAYELKFAGVGGNRTAPVYVRVAR